MRPQLATWPLEMTDLETSVDGLKTSMPEMSAYWTLTGGQAWLALTLGAMLVAGLILDAPATVVAVNLIVTALYVAAFAYKFHLAHHALWHPSLVTVSDDEALAIPDGELPVYTVLVPAYREAGIVARTLRALEALDYPPNRLDVKFLLEEDDLATIAAVRAARPGQNVEILLVPRAHPRTKPKACNFGLTQARGEFVTIYDAEDRPERLQLRRAVAAFRRLGSKVACLQAKLGYHNSTQNLITRLFTVEYLTWFEILLPALAQRGGPVPLGGTSMHINRAVLESVGGWDPYNVTEDADLGIRLQRFGYRTAVLNSTTYEESNSDFVNWVKQRSRWYKGYLQTWLVHMRHPLRLRRELGTEPFLAFTLTIGATPIVAFLNPIFWLLTALWFGTKAQFIPAMFPSSVYYAGLFCMVFGNFMVMYLSVIAIRATGHTNLLAAVLLSPVYWAMMSIAAVKAFLQLFIAPYLWEKTTHGLDQPQEVSAGGVLHLQPVPSKALPADLSMR